MDKLIEIKVNGSMVTKDSHVAGAAGEGNATRLRIEFDAGWDAYAKTVTFWDAKGENPTRRILTADLLEDMTESHRIYLTSVPPEVTNIAGKIDLAIDGFINGRRRRSAYDALTIKYAPNVPIEDQIIDPTPTQAEQLQTQIDTLLEDITEQAVRAETAAENAENSAENAEGSAEAAETAAETASGAAGTAVSAANTAAIAAEAADRSRLAAQQAQTGAENAQQNAATSANEAVDAAGQAKTSAQEAANHLSSVQQVANDINETKSLLQEAIAAKDQVITEAERAEDMIEEATDIAAGAQTSANNAEASAARSEQAAQRAEEAADSAGGAKEWADLGEYEVKSKVYNLNAQAGQSWRGMNINRTYALVFEGTRYEGLSLSPNNDEQTAWNLGGLWDVSTYPVNIFFTNVTVDAEGNLLQNGEPYGTGTYFYDPNYTEFDPAADLQVFDESETGINLMPEEYLPEIIARIKYGKGTLNALPDGTFYFQYKDTKTVYSIAEDRATVEVDLKVQNGYPVILWAGNAEQVVNTDGTLDDYSEQELRHILYDNNLAGRYFSVYEDFHDLGPGTSCKVYECISIDPDWETTGTAVLTCNSWTLSCAREDITPTITAGYVGLKGTPFKIFG